MANKKKIPLLHLSPFNSPGIHSSFDNEGGLSPMTDLALNLSGTSLESLPLPRRLSLSSLSSCSPTPTRIRIAQLQSELTDSPMCVESPTFPDTRLLKNVLTTAHNNSIIQKSRLGVRRTLSSDKENQGYGGSKKSLSTLSFSPPKGKTVGLSLTSPPRPRGPLEDHDTNSQDSGYGASLPDRENSKDSFRFAEPRAIPPRRHSSGILFSSQSSPTQLSSPCTDEDGFFHLLDTEKLDEDERHNLPSSMNSLFSGPIFRDAASGVVPLNDGDELIDIPDTGAVRSGFRRAMSLVEPCTTPVSRRARSCLFKSPSVPPGLDQSTDTLTRSEPSSPVLIEKHGCSGWLSQGSFKRPDPPRDGSSPIQNKRHKANSLQSICENYENKEDVHQKMMIPFLRSKSETHTTIMKAMEKSVLFPELIGDCSRPYVLPLIKGRHQDLKSISSSTLAALIKGEFKDAIPSFRIIDCRFPYEFEGGHIHGAVNIFSEQQLLKDFIETAKKPDEKNEVLIFHCEFSSERGPSMSRFLRNQDRNSNKESYPSLYFPELYILHGGYKDFYENFKELCEPQSYKTMIDPENAEDLRHFRGKSRSWNGDKGRVVQRNSLKRLGL